METHHRDPETGAYFLTADDGDSLILRPLATHDEAVPNSNAVAADALIRLAALTGNDALRARADRVLAGMSGATAKNVLAHGATLNAIDTRLGLAEIVAVGPNLEALADAALKVPFPLRVVARASDGVGARQRGWRPASPPRRRKERLLCASGSAVSLPVSDPAQIVAAVGEMMS